MKESPSDNHTLYAPENIDSNSIGQRVRELRIISNMTQSQLAEKINSSDNYIGHIEQGVKRPGLETMVRLCETLNCSLDYLVLGISGTGREFYIPNAVVQVFNSTDDAERRRLMYYLNNYFHPEE